MQRFDVRDEPGRMIRLAEEDGLETWLDIKTGLQSVGLPIGALEMDMNDGELVPQMVDSLIAASLAYSSRYHPAIMKVIYGGANPEHAIAEVEN